MLFSPISENGSVNWKAHLAWLSNRRCPRLNTRRLIHPKANYSKKKATRLETILQNAIENEDPLRPQMTILDLSLDRFASREPFRFEAVT